MTLVLPDALVVVRAVLTASTDMTALVAGARISVDQQTTAGPFVVLTLTGGTAAVPQRLDAAEVSIDAYASPTARGAASLAARTARAVLLDARNIVTAGGVYVSGRDVTGVAQRPDDRTPPLIRYGFAITAYVRPI